MQHILVYGDSLSWGLIPGGSRERFTFDQRWPGRLELALNAARTDLPTTPGLPAYRVIEDCLNGRRTVWQDPFKAGRNGQAGLAQCIESHSPLALVIIMLGVNDFQSSNPPLTAWHAAQGIAALVGTIRQAPIESSMIVPPLLIVAPPLPRPAASDMQEKFAGAHLKAIGLSAAYAAVAQQLNCSFFDAAAAGVTASAIDGIHLDRDQHALLAERIAHSVLSIINPTV